MVLQVQHKFRSQKTDGTDPTQIKPSNWNDDHKILMNGPKLIGRVDAGEGEATEISLGVGLTLADGILSGGAIYTGSDVNNLNFPIGSYVFVQALKVRTPRNAIAAIYVADGINGYYLTDYGKGVLAGSWRHRGLMFEYGGNLGSLFQRVL
jgi:hypothetical protein